MKKWRCRASTYTERRELELAFSALTDINFQMEVLESEQPVLVEFYTEWSGRHHIISPGLRETDEIYGTHVKFCRINTDIYKEIANEYSVQTIPTILLFKRGQLVDHIIGIVPKAVVVQKLRDLLNGNFDYSCKTLL
jgi:thioredoxin 1